ncbi:MAG: efflux RND transporter periplasmic adaptor subunit [Gemmatimonadota bacterium]
MSSKKQIGISVAIIAVSVTVAAVQVRGNAEEADQGETGGHNHAAMAAGGDEAKPVHLNPEQARLIGVTYAQVERRVLRPRVRTVGSVTYDETRLASVNPKISGWAERLYVNFTGAPVKEGDPLLEVYSPQLVTAQEELLLAARLARSVEGGPESRAAANARQLLEAARRRLAYWDIPADEIRRIEETGEFRKTLLLRSPATGIVVAKNVVEGDRIMPGMVVFEIADLSTVWIDTDVYEKDLALVRDRLPATARFDAYPGREFPGRVAYVYPTVDMKTRTGQVRLELPNPGLELRPGMYAEVDISASAGPPTLVVPRGAVLTTGERSIVFVVASDGMLNPTEVVRGRTIGDDIEILKGLEDGQTVVSSASFLIDAESSLSAGMAGMPGMDMGGDEPAEPEMPGMDMGGAAAGSMDGSDHSSHGN